MSFPLNTSKNVISCNGGEECEKQGHLRDNETKTCVLPGSVLGRLLMLRMKTDMSPQTSAILPIETEINDDKKTEESPHELSVPSLTTISKEESGGKVTVIVNNHNNLNTSDSANKMESTRFPLSTSYRSSRGSVLQSEEVKGEIKEISAYSSSKTIDQDKFENLKQKCDALEKKFEDIQRKILEKGAEAKIQESAARKIEKLKFEAEKKLDFYKKDLLVIESSIRLLYADITRSGEKLEDDKELANKKVLYEETNSAIQRSQSALEQIGKEFQKEVEKNQMFVSEIKSLQTEATMTMIQLTSARENLKDYKLMFRDTTNASAKLTSSQLSGGINEGLTKKEAVLKQFAKLLQDNGIKPLGETRQKFNDLMKKATLSKNLSNGVEEFLKLNI
jgi:molecular chaperone GrpE (heat shock protein)